MTPKAFQPESKLHVSNQWIIVKFADQIGKPIRVVIEETGRSYDHDKIHEADSVFLFSFRGEPANRVP